MRDTLAAIDNALRAQMDFGLFLPRFIVAAIFAAIVSALICWPVWPGFMSYDSLFAYKESIEGIQTATWPPVYPYLFAISRTLGAGSWGLFLAQTFILFFGAGMILSMAVRRLSLMVGGLIVFAAFFIYFPTMLGTVFALWKDVATASFGVLGIALWLLAIRTTSFAWLASAIGALCFAVAQRYNALPLFAPIFVLIVLTPFGKNHKKYARGFAAVALIVGLCGVYASTTWRLPDFQPIPGELGAVSGMYSGDLIGVSACADQDFLPRDVTSGKPMTGEQIRRLFNPRHGIVTKSQIQSGLPANGKALWKRVVVNHLGCYLSYKTAVFVEVMGLDRDSVFYPTHGGIDSNPYGIRLAHPQAAQQATMYVLEGSNVLWRRPIILYIAALILTLAIWLLNLPGKALLSAMMLGVLAFLAALFIVAPAGDARYIFPSSVFCALALVYASAQLITHYQAERIG